MSAEQTVTLRCDFCAAERTDHFLSRQTATEARKQARSVGWRRDKLGRDVCPRHAKLKGAKVLRCTSQPI